MTIDLKIVVIKEASTWEWVPHSSGSRDKAVIVCKGSLNDEELKAVVKPQSEASTWALGIFMEGRPCNNQKIFGMNQQNEETYKNGYAMIWMVVSSYHSLTYAAVCLCS